MLYAFYSTSSKMVFTMNTSAEREEKSTPRDRGESLALAPYLIMGEDAQAYADILARISTAVGPRDIFEDIWVQEIGDDVREGIRLRRLLANLMTATAH
jgi:hypothetical protein